MVFPSEVALQANVFSGDNFRVHVLCLRYFDWTVVISTKMCKESVFVTFNEETILRNGAFQGRRNKIPRPLT